MNPRHAHDCCPQRIRGTAWLAGVVFLGLVVPRISVAQSVDAPTGEQAPLPVEPSPEQPPAPDTPAPDVGGALPALEPAPPDPTAQPENAPPSARPKPARPSPKVRPTVEDNPVGPAEVGRNVGVGAGIALATQGPVAVGLFAVAALGLGLAAASAAGTYFELVSSFGASRQASVYYWLIAFAPWYLFVPMAVATVGTAVVLPLMTALLAAGGAVLSGVLTWQLLSRRHWLPRRSLVPAWCVVLASTVSHAIGFAPLWLLSALVAGVATAGNILLLMVPSRILMASPNLGTRDWGTSFATCSCLGCCLVLPPALAISNVALAVGNALGFGGSTVTTSGVTGLASLPPPTRTNIQRLLQDLFPEENPDAQQDDVDSLE